MKDNYMKCGIMNLLLKGLVKKCDSLWRVQIGGKSLGFITTGGYAGYRVHDNRFGEMDYPAYNTRNFMKALSMFIHPAIAELEKQGESPEYVGKIGRYVDTNVHFEIDSFNNFLDSWMIKLDWSIKLNMDDGVNSIGSMYAEKKAKELRYMELLGLVELA